MSSTVILDPNAELDATIAWLLSRRDEAAAELKALMVAEEAAKDRGEMPLPDPRANALGKEALNFFRAASALNAQRNRIAAFTKVLKDRDITVTEVRICAVSGAPCDAATPLIEAEGR